MSPEKCLAAIKQALRVWSENRSGMLSEVTWLPSVSVAVLFRFATAACAQTAQTVLKSSLHCLMSGGMTSDRHRKEMICPN